MATLEYKVLYLPHIKHTHYIKDIFGIVKEWCIYKDLFNDWYPEIIFTTEYENEGSLFWKQDLS